MTRKLRVVRDPGCPKRPFVIVDEAGFELEQRKRGGGSMARHFASREAAERVIAKFDCCNADNR